MSPSEAAAKLDPTLYAQSGELFRIVQGDPAVFACSACAIGTDGCRLKRTAQGCLNHAMQVGLVPESAYYVTV